ncbi:DUF4136 domain-containing protein [Pseudomonas sp. F1_0610]|uniref:DUF4136 domain-containing protein n=1 Tax=Pseudomonas sp. F1_0610 TaxID=3114284 RepID=UPI0039C06526
MLNTSIKSTYNSALLLGLLLLSGCQTSSLKQLDYEKNYDYSTIDTWQWDAAKPINFKPDSADIINDIDRQRVADIVTEQFTLQGLKQLTQNAQVSIKAWIIYGDNTQVITQYLPDMRIGMQAYPNLNNSQIVEQKQEKITLQIDILDTKTQQLIWRASSQGISQSAMTNPDKRKQFFNKHITRILHAFPPKPADY